VAAQCAIAASSEVDCLFNLFAAFPSLNTPDASLHFRMWWRKAANAASSEVDYVFNFSPLFPSIKTPDASLHFRMWLRNASNAASSEVDCLFQFFAAFSLYQNAGCLPALPDVAAQCHKRRLLGG